MKTTLSISLFALIISLSANLSAQNQGNLYLPREFSKAYLQQTRDHSGMPGKNYFQNRAVYTIQASFNPETKILTGTEVISYVNNSRDSLGSIYLNLYQNLYKKGAPRDAGIEATNIHDGVEILSVKAGGTDIPADKFRTYSTIFSFPLMARLAPNGTINIEIRWKEKMPVSVARRQGTYHDSNFFIAYWYPRLCVYDDIEGWNAAGHTGQAEFYSDFADYNVEITVPAAYTVWSSASLLNEKDIYQAGILDRLALSAVSDSVVRVITEADRKENRITKPAASHTWKYQSFNQLDFAFALSNTYIWDATSTPVGNGRVRIHSVYRPESVNCGKIPGIARQAIRYYSTVSPALPYPEKEITLFEGGPGGMEFPGMINQQNFKEAMETMMVTVHELGHAYLPFYAGVNEQKYGWMDEGIFTLIGFLAFCDQAGDRDLNFLQLLCTKYSEDAGSQAVDVPVMQMSYKLGDFTYGFVTYVKPTAAFILLYDYLGRDKFTGCVREFLIRWKGLHPTPYDLFNTFNQAAGEELTWFWKPWFFEFGYADLAIGKVETKPDGNQIEILKTGIYPVPVKLVVRYADGTEKRVSEKMSCWKSGETQLLIKAPAGEISEIILNPVLVPESDYGNNSWRK